MYWQDPFPCHPPVLGIAFIAFAEKGWVVPRYPFVLAVPSSAFPRYRGWYRQIRKGWVYFFRSLVLVVPFRYWVQAQGAATHLWKRDGGDKRSQTAVGVRYSYFLCVWFPCTGSTSPLSSPGTGILAIESGKGWQYCTHIWVCTWWSLPLPSPPLRPPSWRPHAVGALWDISATLTRKSNAVYTLFVLQHSPNQKFSLSSPPSTGYQTTEKFCTNNWLPHLA